MFFLSSWFVGALSRSAAEKRLLVPGIPSGSFLIRNSETKHGYTLSMRFEDGVRNYLINTMKMGGIEIFFIHKRATFRSLAQLVEHYSNDADGILCKLILPCGVAEQLIKFRHYTGSSPKIDSKLEAGWGQADEGKLVLFARKKKKHVHVKNE